MLQVPEYALTRTAASRLVDARQAARARLEDAVETFAAEPGWTGLQDVVDAIPPASAVDLALVRLRDTGRSARFHLVAASGLSAREHARLAFDPLTLGQERALLAAGSHASLGYDLGLRWLRGVWLRAGTALGTLLVGCRTLRRPEQDDLDLVTAVADDVSPALASLDRRRTELRRRSGALARHSGVGLLRREPLPNLRSREIEILELYADGLGTAEIAELLVISPHTVRTHVRNALRRLSVRSRHEAIERLLRWQVGDVFPADGALRKSA